jgi:predicted DNA-binding transcriptional regulator AlpA
MTDKLLSNDEAATFLGLSPKTLPKWRVSGTGPKFVRLGRRVMYRPSDLEDWISGRIRTSTTG